MLINKVVCPVGRKYCDQGQRVKQVGEGKWGGTGGRGEGQEGCLRGRGTGGGGQDTPDSGRVSEGKDVIQLIVQLKLPSFVNLLCQTATNRSRNQNIFLYFSLSRSLDLTTGVTIKRFLPRLCFLLTVVTLLLAKNVIVDQGKDSYRQGQPNMSVTRRLLAV